MTRLPPALVRTLAAALVAAPALVPAAPRPAAAQAPPAAEAPIPAPKPLPPRDPVAAYRFRPPPAVLPSTPPAVERQRALDYRRDLSDALRERERLDALGGADIEDRRRTLEMRGERDRIDRLLGR
jgi:hypothetical protein